MTLAEYFMTTGAKQADLARAIDVHGVLISQWTNGDRPVPVKHRPAIERATGGMVRCEDMGDEVDWAYIRSTGCDCQC